MTKTQRQGLSVKLTTMTIVLIFYVRGHEVPTELWIVLGIMWLLGSLALAAGD